MAIACPDCRAILSARYPDQQIFSPFWVETDIHVLHQPMHPNEVGGAHRRRARQEYEQWEALSPLAPTQHEETR